MERGTLVLALAVLTCQSMFIAGASGDCGETCTANQECDGTDTCICLNGYEGDPCTEIDECDSNPCQNAGTCADAIASYTCACATGWEGTHCALDIDECASNPCQTTEVCKDEVAGYTCTVACDDTDNVCANGATCGAADSTCICAPGYAGDLCDSDIDECASNPCQNTEVCKDDVAGYTCTVACDDTDNVCANGGTCGTADRTCICAPGYAGDLCDSEIDECDSGPCQNAGTCADAVASYTCACATGWTGTNCESESGASLSTASGLILALALALTKMATD